MFLLSFCSDCVEKQVGVDSKCPECGAFAWVKDLKTNRQLVNTVNACVRLRSLVGSQDSDKFDIKSDGNLITDTLCIINIVYSFITIQYLEFY